MGCDLIKTQLQAFVELPHFSILHLNSVQINDKKAFFILPKISVLAPKAIESGNKSAEDHDVAISALSAWWLHNDT